METIIAMIITRTMKIEGNNNSKQTRDNGNEIEMQILTTTIKYS